MAAGPITFSFADWTAAWPEFANCSPAQGQAWFDIASIYCPNTSANPFGDSTSTFLYMLTSHVAWLLAPRDPAGNPAAAGQSPPNIVGRINSASEGSVSVGAEWKGSGSPSQDWFVQTRYGALYWQATAAFRTMRYAARPTLVAHGIYPFRRRSF